MKALLIGHRITSVHLSWEPEAVRSLSSSSFGRLRTCSSPSVAYYVPCGRYRGDCLLPGPVHSGYKAGEASVI